MWGSWGTLQIKNRVNALADAICIPGGAGGNAAEFLSFDSRSGERRLFLCRFSEEPLRCDVREIKVLPSPSRALTGQPRQLVLCPTARLFASLTVQGGQSEVELWSLNGESYTSAGIITESVIPGVRSAKVIRWLDEGMQGWLSVAGGAAVLSMLLQDAVALVATRVSDSVEFVELLRLNVNFRPTAFCWSRNGTQLLVGGQGQMSCFTWNRAPGPDSAPQTRHYLCGGNCVEIQSVYNTAFVCRVDQHAQSSAPQVGSSALALGSLLLPSGDQIQPSDFTRNQLVVEVGSNPQDGPQLPSLMTGAASLGGLTGSSSEGIGGYGSMSSICAAAPSIIPQKRFLVPLSTDLRTSRLSCGTEIEIHGELLATASYGRLEVVAVGSFDGAADAKVWKLESPHRWSRVSTVLQQMEGVNLGISDEVGPLRFRGLALWPTSQGLSLHAALDKPSTASSVFSTRQTASELHHRMVALPDLQPAVKTSSVLSTPSIAVSSAAESDSSPGKNFLPVDDSRDAEVVAQGDCKSMVKIAEGVVGIREELRELKCGFKEFQNDFRRLVTAIETLATSRAPQQ